MRLLVPLPKHDLDPTEVAIPWSVLRTGCEIVFATSDGVKALPDEELLTGEHLGILAPILTANKEAKRAWEELETRPEFCEPIPFSQASEEAFDAILLPGGQAQSVREYLESELLQNICLRHMQKEKPIGAIGQGILVLARGSSSSGRSLLYGKKVTALPKSAELFLWEVTKKSLGDRYLTYPDNTVEDEVKSHLKEKSDFVPGPPLIFRDSLKRLWAGHTVVDGNLVSARWAGDAHVFALELKELLL